MLKERVEAGSFREDLYHRLSDARVVLPPLRDRPQELPLLASAFLAEACAKDGRAAPYLSAAAMEALSAYPWPGNVRELKKTMAYVAAMCTGPIVEPSHLPEDISRPRLSKPAPAPAEPRERLEGEPPGKPVRRTFRPLAEEVRELERQRMLEALEATEGVQTRAAQLIGMPLRTFAFKLKRYKISWRGEGSAS
jgi:DNA-binding NtrC family response regulator